MAKTRPAWIARHEDEITRSDLFTAAAFIAYVTTYSGPTTPPLSSVKARRWAIEQGAKLAHEAPATAGERRRA